MSAYYECSLFFVSSECGLLPTKYLERSVMLFLPLWISQSTPIVKRGIGIYTRLQIGPCGGSIPSPIANENPLHLCQYSPSFVELMCTTSNHEATRIYKIRTERLFIVGGTCVATMVHRPTKACPYVDVSVRFRHPCWLDCKLLSQNSYSSFVELKKPIYIEP